MNSKNLTTYAPSVRHDSTRPGQRCSWDPKAIVLTEGLFGDHYTALDHFDPVRYQHMLAHYKEFANSECNEDERSRNYVRLLILDAHGNVALDNDESIRALFKDSGKRVEELPLSLVL